MKRKNFEILNMFLDKKVNILYVCSRMSEQFFVYTIDDKNYCKTEFTESGLKKITELYRKLKYARISSIDTYYFQEGGAIRMFLGVLEEGNYYVFLDTKHHYNSKLHSLQTPQIYKIRELLNSGCYNVYLSRTFTLPMDDCFEDFIKYFIGEKR